jgi:hypothetical protein
LATSQDNLRAKDIIGGEKVKKIKLIFEVKSEKTLNVGGRKLIKKIILDNVLNTDAPQAVL